MSLRLKVSLIILAIGGAFVTVALVFLNVGLFSSFRSLQGEFVYQETERAEGDIYKEAEHLGVLATDWAVWDDTYAFVAGEDEDYAASNLSPDAHMTSRLDILGITDTEGRWVHLGLFDRDEGEPFTVDGFPSEGLEPGDSLWPREGAGGTSGLMRYGDQPFLIGSHVILPSSGEGEPRGLVVMGRRLLPEDVRALSDHAGAQVVLRAYEPSPDREPAPLSWPETRLLGNDYAQATTLLPDLGGRPILELEVTISADILQSGRMALNSTALANIGAIVTISLVLLVLIRRLIVSRVEALGRGLETIRGDGDLSRRVVTDGGHDELGQLCSSVNALLATLEQRTEALNEAVRIAEDAAEARSRFLARMSHEIRTPISGILGLLELLRDGGGADDEVSPSQYIETIEDSATSLLSLINDVLDMSKIEADRLEIVPVPTALGDFAERLVRSLSALAQAKELTLSAHVDEAIDAAVMVDAARLRQVLTNLLGNALKFTHAGAVRLEITLAGRSADALNLRFAVRDTGPGIAESDQKRLFEDYFQIEGTGQNGTGLGLAISQQLVSLMGGQIEVDSRPGQGASFAFTLELPTFDPAIHSGVVGRVASDKELSLEGMRVMVVDDDPINRMVAEKVLSRVGAEVTDACDGVEALEIFAHSPVDVIFIDSRMPRMDGIAATRALRQLDEAGAKVPIIAMSASVLKGDREAWAEAGADEFVCKPVDYTHLCWLAKRLTRQRGHDDSAGAEAGRAHSGPRPVAAPPKPTRTPAQTPPALAAAPILDVEDAIERYGDLETVAEVVSVLLESAARRIAAIRGHAERADRAAVVAEAHTIKGSAAMISARRMAEAASDLETLARVSAEAPIEGAILNLERALAELRGEWSEGDVAGTVPAPAKVRRVQVQTDSASFPTV